MDLTALVREDFGIPLIGVQPTGLGADERASLWRGLTMDGASYAVKTSSAYTPASGGVTRSDLDAGRLTYYRGVRALTDSSTSPTTPSTTVDQSPSGPTGCASRAGHCRPKASFPSPCRKPLPGTRFGLWPKTRSSPRGGAPP